MDITCTPVEVTVIMVGDILEEGIMEVVREMEAAAVAATVAEVVKGCCRDVGVAEDASGHDGVEGY